MKRFKHKNKTVFRVKPCRYLVVEVNKSRLGLPFYFAKHWKGLEWPGKENKSDRSYHFSLLCIHATYNSHGLIVRPDNWPKGWL